jgi:16S rRNA (uracil1498-N3)-methyltransferase
MPVNRYYHSEDLVSGKEILLEEAESRHLAVATRGRTGETVEVLNGKGSLAQAVVQHIDKRKGVLLKLQSVQQETPPKQEVILYQALARPNRLETIVEKCTELGVTEIQLFPGERSERGKTKRLENIAISAMKQCGRLYLPKIHEVVPIAKWEKFSQQVLFGDLSKEAIPFPVGLAAKESVGVVIGPESGLSPKELTLLKELGAQGVTLHKNTLRTDTAAIIAVALLTAPMALI